MVTDVGDLTGDFIALVGPVAKGSAAIRRGGMLAARERGGKLESRPPIGGSAFSLPPSGGRGCVV